MTATPSADPSTAGTAFPDPSTVAIPAQRQAPPAQAAPRRVRHWPWGLGGLVLGIALGAGVGGGDAAPPAPPAAAAAPSTVTLPAPPPETVVVEVPAAPPVPAPAETGPLSSFDDGVYEIGIDIEPGKYKTPGRAAPTSWTPATRRSATAAAS